MCTRFIGNDANFFLFSLNLLIPITPNKFRFIIYLEFNLHFKNKIRIRQLFLGLVHQYMHMHFLEPSLSTWQIPPIAPLPLARHSLLHAVTSQSTDGSGLKEQMHCTDPSLSVWQSPPVAPLPLAMQLFSHATSSHSGGGGLDWHMHLRVISLSTWQNPVAPLALHLLWHSLRLHVDAGWT